MNLKSALLNELVIALDVTIIVCYMQDYAWQKARKSKAWKNHIPGEKVRKGTWIDTACKLQRFVWSFNNLVRNRANMWHW